jgi:hypothetical protein
MTITMENTKKFIMTHEIHTILDRKFAKNEMDIRETIIFD